MSIERNHYQILGLSPEVSSDEIKRAYRKLAKSQHPDARHHSSDMDESLAATEAMMRINEAYSILIDQSKRAEYDIKIGLRMSISTKKPIFTSVDEDRERERFLRSVFYPVRASISKVLAAYNRKLRELSADPYDDQLVEAFECYVNQIEDCLRRGSDSFMNNPIPRTLEASVLVMRQSMAQAADGLEELRYYLGNYDYGHLTTAESLFRISNELSKQALELTKGR